MFLVLTRFFARIAPRGVRHRDPPRSQRDMALSLDGTAPAIFAFTVADSEGAIIASSATISLAAATAYAAIYSYTPEVFDADVLGIATDTASDLSRLASFLPPCW